MSVAMDNEGRALGRVGSVLKDKYRLDALLGVGGMSAVYAATHRNAKRVAIKMILPELANDQEIRSRFVREGYAANTIEHPGALSVLDDDVSEEGLPYLVMELLEGQTVEARWETGGKRLELPEVLSIAGALLDVLAAAHAKGVVHRDIKPENLFLLRTGGLKVLDFGIARVLEATRAKTTSTRAGTVMGTPAFMAPEQALAKWEDVDGRTDLWAVGATMFTLITGQHVHEGETGNEQLIKSATQPARPLASLVKGLPRSVVALVDRSLKFDRNARWPDAKSMGEAVRGAYEALTGSPLVIEAPATSGIVSSRGANLGEGAPSPRRPPPPPPPPAAPPRTNSGQMAAPPRTTSGQMPAVAPPVRTTSGQMPAVAPPVRPSSGQIVVPVAARPSNANMPAYPRTASGQFGQVGMGGHASASVLGVEPTQASMAAPDVHGGGGLAPPTMAALSVDAFVAGRMTEKNAAGAEVARLQPIVAEVQGRLSEARKRVAQMQEQIGAARKERANEEERFRRQTNARLEGVGEARKALRKSMSEVARIALTDPRTFPPEVGAAERVEIEKTRIVSDARERESALHDAALDSYDKKKLQTGLALAIGGTLLFLILFFSPVIIRSCSSDTGTLDSSSE